MNGGISVQEDRRLPRSRPGSHPRLREAGPGPAQVAGVPDPPASASLGGRKGKDCPSHACEGPLLSTAEEGAG